MVRIQRLTTVKGKRLERLIEAVNETGKIKMVKAYWMKLGQEERMTKLAGLFAMHQFSPEQLQTIYRKVFDFQPNWKLIFSLAGIGLIAIISYWYYTFANLPRVYAIGNDVAVYIKPDSSGEISSRMDIWGTIVSGRKGSTAETMILRDEKGPMFTVEPDKFFGWLFRKNRVLYVSKRDATSNEAEYEEHKEILSELKGKTVLASLSSGQRRIIYHCIRTNNDFFKSRVSNSFSDEELRNFKPVVSADGAGERYLFFALKTPAGKFENIKITYRDDVFSNYKKVNFLGQTFSNPLMFKDSFYNKALQPNPILMFKERAAGTLFQSFAPPYDQLIK